MNSQKKYLSTVRKTATAFAVYWVSILLAGHPITIDGLFHDWNNVPVSYTDIQGDGGQVDFANIKITYDNEFLFIYFNFYDGEFLLQKWNDIHLLIDMDNDSTTGHPIYGIGAELDWAFGDRSGVYYIMLDMIAIDQQNLTLRMAPTITADEFEICISRSSYIVTMDNTQTLEQGQVILAAGSANSDKLPSEYGGVFFAIGTDTIAPAVPISFNKGEDTDLRLVSHNVWNSSITDPANENYFKRIYQALNPDIVALQEIYSNSNQLQSLFNDWFPDEQWYLSNQFRDNIIVSKYPIIAQDVVTMSERTMVALLNTTADLGTNLLIFNSHLACCENDESRQNDVDEFVSVWRGWRENNDGPFTLAANTPFVHVGDFNLVGDRQQLTTLTTGDILDEDQFGSDFALDWDGTAITDLFSRHSHKRMGYTWRSDNSSYSPGKLDYILYTDSILDTANHFVLHTLTMDSTALAEYGLDALDSYHSSDHAPRVLDFRPLEIVHIGATFHPHLINIKPPFPNPFNGSTQIQLELKDQVLLQVNIVDITGRKVHTYNKGLFAAGLHNIAIDMSNFSTGIYFLQFLVDDYVQTFKIAVVQ